MNQLFPGRAPLSQAGVIVTERNALTFTAVFAAINRIATDVASLSLKVYERLEGGARREAPEHPAYQVLAVEPNPEMSSFRWRQDSMGHVLGWGGGFAELVFDGNGDLKAAWPLSPATTTADRKPQDKRLFYRLEGGKTLPPWKVLHFAGLGFDGVSGYCPIRMHRQAVGLGLAAELFGASFYGNGTTPGGVVEHPGRLGADGNRNLRDSIEEEHRGPQAAHKVLVLEEGAKWVQNVISPENAQFLATRQFQVVEVARMFNLPPHKLGDYSQAHLNSIEEANIEYVQTTLVGWLSMIEAELNRKVFSGPDRGRYFVEFNVTSFLRGNMAARAAFYKELVQLGAMTPNEVRRRENLDSLGKVGEVHLVPANFTTLEAMAAGTAPAMKTPPAKPAPADPTPAPTDNPADNPPDGPVPTPSVIPAESTP